MKLYWLLYTREDERQPWVLQFGSYKFKEVRFESHEYDEQCLIVSCSNKQEDIDQLTASLNFRPEHN